jgi:hypothetical protein
MELGGASYRLLQLLGENNGANFALILQKLSLELSTDDSQQLMSLCSSILKNLWVRGLVTLKCAEIPTSC